MSFLRKQQSRVFVPPKSPLDVIPAKAGIQLFFLGSCLRRNDTSPLDSQHRISFLRSFPMHNPKLHFP